MGIDKSHTAQLIDRTEAVTITSGQQVSAAIDLLGMTVIGLRIPAAFTGTSITIQESATIGGTYNDVYGSDGALLSISASASRTILFAPSALVGIEFLKLKSNA